MEISRTQQTNEETEEKYIYDNYKSVINLMAERCLPSFSDTPAETEMGKRDLRNVIIE